MLSVPGGGRQLILSTFGLGFWNNVVIKASCLIMMDRSVTLPYCIDFVTIRAHVSFATTARRGIISWQRLSLYAY